MNEQSSIIGDWQTHTMRQSAAVNHSQDGFTLILTKLLLIDGEKVDGAHV